MSYFNPEENIFEIFLQNKDVNCFFENHQDSFKNVDLDLDFTFSNETFSFDFFDEDS